MFQQQTQQYVPVGFSSIRNQKGQVPLEMPPILKNVLPFPQLNPVKIQSRRQFAVEVFDQFSQIRRNLQLATEQAIGKLVQLFGIDIERQDSNPCVQDRVPSLRSASRFGHFATKSLSAFHILPKTARAGN